MQIPWVTLNKTILEHNFESLRTKINLSIIAAENKDKHILITFTFNMTAFEILSLLFS